jgi:hypothetical protein
MKRVCSLCLMEFSYKEVKKHKHGLQLCDHCVDERISGGKGRWNDKQRPFSPVTYCKTQL